VAFRINPLNGSLSIQFPDSRRQELGLLLKDAFEPPVLRPSSTIAEGDLRLGAGLKRLNSRQALQHGGVAALIVGVDLIFPIPALLLSGATALLLLPLVSSVIKHVRSHRELPVDSLDLGFSSVLISQGMAGEALIDLAIGDASTALQSVFLQGGLDPLATGLVDRLGHAITVTITAPWEGVKKLLEIKEGDRYRAEPQSLIYLNSRIDSGEITVFNRLVDGEWAPRLLRAGDRLQPGSFVIQGQAELVVEQTMLNHAIYAQSHEPSRALLQQSRVQNILNLYAKLVAPALLVSGSYWYLTGAIQRSLSAFQFNPLNDWQTSNLASRLTAMAELRLHRLQIRDPNSLRILSKINHLVISRSCLDQIGGILPIEHLQPQSTVPDHTLLRLLAGMQRFLVTTDSIPIWSTQLSLGKDPLPVDQLDLDNGTGGWRVRLVDGRVFDVSQQSNPPASIPRTHLNPLEIRQGDRVLGYVELHTSPDPSWVELSKALGELGVVIHIVGSDKQERIAQMVAPLALPNPDTIHGECTWLERLDLVKQLQADGSGVAYVGYVMNDMPAAFQADVSISIDVDDDSAFTEGICDVVIDHDAVWIARLIDMSRRLEATANSNFGLIGITHLLSAAATATALINPLQTVLLADVPLVLAELRNLAVMSNLKGRKRFNSPYNA
jgi:soluble P-type ATPase